MRVLVACEFSGIVRDAFLERGHDAWSCDLLPTERPGPHIHGDVRQYVRQEQGWDIMIAFPPCTHLAVSGARWFPAKQASGEQAAALEFVGWFFRWPGKVVVENPIGIISTQIKRPTQIIQPWQFGHPEVKATCLWLQGGLPTLKPTNIVEGRKARVHREPPSPVRWKNRSRTYQGIADAMADQWGSLEEVR
jgi:site-specific DNA-cytosine methylase